MRIAAYAGGQSAVAKEAEFSMIASEEMELMPNNFGFGYSPALNFFGDEERFMFTYSWNEGRSINIDPQWEDKYIV